MAKWLGKLFGGSGGQRTPDPPVIPSCEVYLRDDAWVIVAAYQDAEFGFHCSGDPVIRLPAKTGNTELGQALLRALAAFDVRHRGNTESDDAFIQRTTGHISRTALERGAKNLSVRQESGCIVITCMEPLPGGSWRGATTQRIAGATPEGIGNVLMEMAVTATPRGVPHIRRPKKSGDIRPSSVTDTPQPFGYKTRWLTISSNDPHAVADKLRLRDLHSCSWREGSDAVHKDWRHTVYVTPVVEGWAFVLNANVPEDEHALRELLQELSRDFGEVQAYVNVRTSSCYMWAKAEDGELLRAFYLADGEYRINTGTRTDTEIELGLGEPDDDPDHWPDEDDVLRIADRWSINPSELGDQPTAGSGWLGKA